MAAGAKAVYVLGRRSWALEQCRDTSARPGAIVPVVCDVACDQSVSGGRACEERRGYCDLLLANASTLEAPHRDLDHSAGLSIQKGLWATDVSHHERTLRVNTFGAYHTAIAVLDPLDEGNRRDEVSQKSQVIMTPSLAGQMAPCYPDVCYCASKAAFNLVAKQLGSILLPHKIRINVLVAGVFVSETTEVGLSEPTRSDPCQEGALDKNFIPLERVGSKDELAGLVLFLASKAGAYVSGAALAMDGGMPLVPPY